MESALSFGDLVIFVAWVLKTRRFEIAFLIGAVVFELVVRSRYARRLLSNGYRLDLTYAAFYRLGIFTILLDTPARAFLERHMTMPVFASAPMWLRVGAYLLVLDFSNYWVHRLEHANPTLWAFHQIHHSQEELTIMATYRNHPVDSWLRSFVGPVFFMLLFGLTPMIWLPLSLLWDVNLNLSHLNVNWRYGPLRWLLVSPVFHAIHHSVEGHHQNRNFGMTLSVWDHLFGTAETSPERPRLVGLPGWKVRESFLAHCWAPIRGLACFYRGLSPDELAPLTAMATRSAVADRPLPANGQAASLEEPAASR